MKDRYKCIINRVASFGIIITRVHLNLERVGGKKERTKRESRERQEEGRASENVLNGMVISALPSIQLA